MNNNVGLTSSNKKNTKKYLFLAIILLYSLFALNRIKYAIPITVGDSTINNFVLIILFVFFIAIVIYGTRISLTPSFGFLVFFYLLFSVFVSLINGNSISSGFYAMSQIIVPFLGFLFASKLRKNEIAPLISFIIIISGIYAALTIVVSANYNYFSGLLGVSNIVSYVRFARVNMPIGSSITVSYFLNITSPICAISFTKFKRKKVMKLASLISLILSLVAIVLQGSRAAIIVLGVEAIFFFLYILKSKRKLLYILAYLIIAFIVIVYYTKYGDISRFFNRASTVVNSDLTRYEEVIKGLRIFLEYPFFGTGIGTVYSRVESGTLMYNGVTILSDPHNAYIMLLSETGLFGFATILLFFVSFVGKTKKYDSSIHGIFLRRVLLVSILIQSLFGSHLINEPNYSFVFWTLFGLAIAINKEKEMMDW